jgi:hypothetical protein
MGEKERMKPDEFEELRPEQKEFLAHTHNLTEPVFEDLTEEQQDWFNTIFPNDPFSKNRKDLEQQEPPIKLTFEQWHSLLLEKYWKLKEIADSNFAGLWFLLEFELSVQKILNILDCTLPFILIVLGKPGSLKTLGIELLREWKKFTYFVDNYSSKAWVSHSANIKEEKLAQVDMLPKIKNKLFLVSELSPFFAKKYDELAEGIGIITRIADGHGYKSASGVHGDRGYSGEWMFCWIGAAVDIPYKVHKLLGTLGPKLHFVRLPSVKKSEDDYFIELKKEDHNLRFKGVQEALIDYLKAFDLCPELEKSKNNDLLKISWDHNRDDEVSLRQIIKLGILLSHLRAVVPTWETHDTQGTDYAYATAIREQPDRAITQLKNLARGHALSQGRNYISREDIPVVVKTVLSTASIDRVNVFDLLLKHRGTLTTSKMQSSLNLHELLLIGPWLK